jgi:translation initiation factor 2A
MQQPKIHPSALAPTDSNGTSTPTKPAGAYRPPHARGTATPTVFKREDEGGLPQLNGLSNGVSAQRVVPGMAPPEPKEEKKPRRRTKKEKAQPAAESTPAPAESPSAPAPPAPEPAAPQEPAPTVSPEDLKKQRALLKKLRAIEELKLRQAGGEKLEKTQEQKIEKEMEIVQELMKLGFTD